MQRDGHHHVGEPIIGSLRDELSKARGEPFAQAGYFFVFQEHDRFGERCVVHREAAGSIESVESYAAEAAERLYGLRRYRRVERPAAAKAHRVHNALESGEAGLADRDSTGRREGLAADPASTRKHHGCECVERAFQDHGCVVNREGTLRRYSKSRDEGRGGIPAEASLQLPLLFLFLAGNAVSSPGNCLEALLLKLRMAGNALTERTLPDARQCVVH